MAQINITLDQNEILQLLQKDHSEAFRLLLQNSLNSILEGYDYIRLFKFYRSLYGGSKLQNHALNSRVNSEFHNKFKSATNDLIIQNDGKYLIHVDYIFVDNHDISKSACRIIEKYIELLIKKDHTLTNALEELEEIKDYRQKKDKINALLTEDAEARIFEIISYAILKNHYKNIKVYFGYTRETIQEMKLELYKTGRTQMTAELILLCDLLEDSFR